MSDETMIAECTLCETNYTTFRKLRRHFKRRHAELEVLECSFCDYLTHVKVMLKQHKEMLHPDEKFVCKKCGFKTHKWTRMDRHFDKHTTKSSAELPSSEHSDSRSRAKETVQAVVEKLGQLQEIKDTRFQCDSCDKYFKFKSKLTRHFTKKHTQYRPFKCSLCDYAAKTKDDLTVHMRVHTNERPFKCQLCEFKFKTVAHLKNHLKCHFNVRDFACEFCDHKFITKANLKRHMKYHFNVRDFPCEICDHKSRTKINLQSHMRTHTGEKPFICHVCERAFSRKYILKRHLAHVHLATIK